ncbi:MAG: hypothetical protein ABI175_02465 [Polyangiales bacterium]
MNHLTRVAVVLPFLASCAQLSSSFAGGPSKSGSKPSVASTGSSSPTGSMDDHERFKVLEVTLGMVMTAPPGFTCAKPSGNTGREDMHCVKFLDSRCAGKPQSISVLRYGQDAGPGCHFDPSSQATRLDNKLQQTANTGDSTDHTPIRKPLENISITGTRSEPSKIYAIKYMLGFDELTEDSKLYRAMVSKYGEPSSKNPPNEMRWRGDDTRMIANCDRIHCEISVEDGKLDELERNRQEEADGKARRETAAAPSL